MIKKLAFKGQITKEECQNILTKLNGHDEAIRTAERAKTIDNLSTKK